MEIVTQREHYPLQDSEVRDTLDHVLRNLDLECVERLKHVVLEKTWRQWLTKTGLNVVKGLDSMDFAHFVPGVTPCFSEFVSRYHNRRIRVSRSDFVMTKIACRLQNRPLVHLEDQELKPQDAVVMSLPFSGNGGVYPDYDYIIDQACKLGVPVMIDAAYFGISYGLVFDLSPSCITDFCVSLSKPFFGFGIRSGMRFTRHAVDDSLSAPISTFGIFDRISGYVSTKIMQEFQHDPFVRKHQPRQIETCETLGITATPTLTLALGDEDWSDYKRGDYNRVCISSAFS